MINAAIVGTGRWGQRLVDSVSGDNDKIRFTTCVSRDPSKHKDFLARYKLKGVSSLEDALGDSAIDAIVLATPHSQHHGEILASAAAGKHVYVEKPLTLTKATSIEATEALKAKGLTLGVGFSRRFQPAYIALLDTINSGEIGDVLHMESEQSGPSGYRLQEGNWRSLRAESPGGGMTARGVHVLDSMIHIAGPVAAVTAISERRVIKVDVDDVTAMLLRFKSGQTGYLASIYATADIWRVQAYGTKGVAHMNSEQSLIVTDMKGNERVTHFAPIEFVGAGLEAFADAIAGKAPYPVSAEEAINGIATLEALVKSAGQQAWVKVE